MKLLVVLSVLACGYAAKLDRTYLPPLNAATAGGSPGALTAPASGSQPGVSGLAQTGPSSFGQGPSGAQPGASGFGSPQASPSGFGQGPAGVSQPGANGFGSTNIGGPSGNGFSFPKGPSAAPGNTYGSGSESGPTASSGFGSQSGANQAGNGQSSAGPFNQGFGQGSFGPNVAQAYTPERPQAAADRNAEILKYINENNGESYSYSYETSNGISAEEAGEARNGVRAQGGYSYTGDDGKAYSVTYTADENGYQPQGEHLPTPHPIPEEILKSIEENARAAAAGTQEGAYRPEEYENEASPQKYNTGISGFNQPQGQNLGSTQGFQSGQGQAVNQPQNNQYSSTQGLSGQGRPSGPSGQYSQGNQITSGSSNGKGSAGLGFGQAGQGQSANGYNYNQPQNTFGAAAQGQSSQYRPQTNGQGQTSYSAGPSSTGSGSSNNQGTFGSSLGNGRPAAPSFGSSQTQYKGELGQSKVPSGNQVSGTTNQGQQYQPSFGSNQPSFGSNQPSFGPSQGSQYRPGSSGQDNQYQSNGNKNAFGAANGVSQGNLNAGSPLGQGSQNQYGNKPSTGPVAGQSSLSNGNQYSQPSTQNGRGSQQPAFGSNAGLSQGTSQFGSGASGSAGARGSQPVQAPYQYDRPSQTFGSQPQSPGFNNAGSPGTNGRPSQGSQAGTEQFGGPRQPPSFSPQEGYKY